RAAFADRVGAVRREPREGAADLDVGLVAEARVGEVLDAGVRSDLGVVAGLGVARDGGLLAELEGVPGASAEGRSVLGLRTGADLRPAQDGDLLAEGGVLADDGILADLRAGLDLHLVVDPRALADGDLLADLDALAEDRAPGELRPVASSEERRVGKHCRSRVKQRR